MTQLIVFLVIVAFSVISSIVQAANDSGSQAGGGGGPRRKPGQSFEDFLEEMRRKNAGGGDRPVRVKARRVAESQPEPEPEPESFDDRLAAMRRGGNARSEQRRNPQPLSPLPQPVAVAPAAPGQSDPGQNRVTDHHLHSSLDNPRDLSQVDERHMENHVTGRKKRAGLQGQLRRRRAVVPPPPVRTASATQDPLGHLTKLTPIQRGIVMAEIFRRPDPRRGSRGRRT